MDKLIHIIFCFCLTILPQISHCETQQAHNYSICRELSYNCGKLSNISYPFWGHNRPSHCGGGDFFNLNCFIDQNKNETTTILLGSQNFTVLSIDLQTYTMKMKRTDLSFDACAPQFNDTYLSPTMFKFPTRTKNISIFYNCSYDVISYVNDYQSLCGSQNIAICFEDSEGKLLEIIPMLKGCGRHITVQADYAFEPATFLGVIGNDDLDQILDEGFQVKYVVNEECIRCLGSEGYCWNNTNFDNVQSCYYVYCPHGYASSATQCSVIKSVQLRRQEKMKIIIGSAGAAFVGLLICITIFCFKYKSTKNNQDIEAFLKTHEAFTLRRYKFSHIKKMTNNFKVKLGEGGYGAVYKGKLLNDCPVAVKLLKASKGNGEDFMNEVSSITKTSHVNVVALLGFCFEGRKKALIYELMSNGSLDKFIHNKGLETIGASLSLEILYQIAKGIARGLEYLHRGCSTRILHFDIKPHNILLDENFCPKISDFGLSRLCTKKESIISMSNARGTIGYVAPELWNRNFGGVSHKSDVYSYGMMLLEMVGGRKNLNVDASHTSEIYFPHWIYKKLDQGNDLRSNEVIAIEEEDEIARRMTIVGLWCIQTFPNDRPSMSKVIEMLEGNMNSLEIPPKPMLSSPTRTVPESSVS
ncbi:LEAF RUST 10 DISEASE-RESISTANCEUS RECEPTOR-LIKE PROTEIN KINASE-like 2.3 isoform X2 [Cicer arietinum]|uniref:non-specific serine/threonine protein kinase n=1 Tax=Cicer arietinum TaxID=3827 RepID=A0A1S2Z0L6_CICAR|nr:LEAF RUST 10 DISEASE-RESISTANCE LOCUS RECEPTOR-LIKE PROTEIN KINASE-like 2.3 isoform X2 [Cicer arietinum]